MRLRRTLLLLRRGLSRLRGAPSDAERQRARAQFYQGIWSRAAEAVGGHYRELPGGFAEVRHGERVTRMWQQIVQLDDALTLRIAGDKPLTNQLLTERGIPVPEHLEYGAGEPEAARAFLARGPVPCVVKPARRTAGGAGVTTGVRTSTELERADAFASLHADRLLIERQHAGDAYRLLMLDGVLLDAIRRRSPAVVGDGRTDLAGLIEQENRRRAGVSDHLWLEPITVDLDCRATLSAAGLTLRSVPADGQRVQVKTVSNQNGERDNERVTDALAPAVIETAAQAAEALGVRLAGVDIIATDVARPLAESGGIVNEVNTTPGLHFHYQVANETDRVAVAEPILRTLLGI